MRGALHVARGDSHSSCYFLIDSPVRRGGALRGVSRYASFIPPCLARVRRGTRSTSEILHRVTCAQRSRQWIVPISSECRRGRTVTLRWVPPVTSSRLTACVEPRAPFLSSYAAFRSWQPHFIAPRLQLPPSILCGTRPSPFGMALYCLQGRTRACRGRRDWTLARLRDKEIISTTMASIAHSWCVRRGTAIDGIFVVDSPVRHARGPPARSIGRRSVPLLLPPLVQYGSSPTERQRVPRAAFPFPIASRPHPASPVGLIRP